MIYHVYYVYCHFSIWGARWLSGRVSDSGARGPGFETYRRRVVSLSKTLYSPKYWLITQEAMAPSRHDWKIVDWDVKPQHNQNFSICDMRCHRNGKILIFLFGLFLFSFSLSQWTIWHPCKTFLSLMTYKEHQNFRHESPQKMM